MKTGARETQRSQRDGTFQVKHRDRAVKALPDAYLLARGMKLKTGGFVRLEERGSDSLRRMEGLAPAFIRKGKKKFHGHSLLVGGSYIRVDKR